jgi:hypothetical protein
LLLTTVVVLLLTFIWRGFAAMTAGGMTFAVLETVLIALVGALSQVIRIAEEQFGRKIKLPD